MTLDRECSVRENLLADECATIAYHDSGRVNSGGGQGKELGNAKGGRGRHSRYTRKVAGVGIPDSALRLNCEVFGSRRSYTSQSGSYGVIVDEVEFSSAMRSCRRSLQWWPTTHLSS